MRKFYHENQVTGRYVWKIKFVAEGLAAYNQIIIVYLSGAAKKTGGAAKK
jgi:hypothetical protein